MAVPRAPADPRARLGCPGGLALAAALLPGVLRAETPEVEVVFQVVVPSVAVLHGAQVQVETAAGMRTVLLEDDGTDLADAPYDGVYVGRLELDEPRYLDLELTARVNGAQEGQVLYAGLDRLPDARHAVLTWILQQRDDRWLAIRTAGTLSGPRGTVDDRLMLLGAVGWALLVAAYATSLGMVWARRRSAP